MSTEPVNIPLDAIVDPFEAKVIYSRDAHGQIIDAHFDLSGLPRLEPMLLGKNVVDVVEIVKRLCGICPVPHHLAGMGALDRMNGVSELPPTAAAVRELLLYGAILDTLSVKFFNLHPETAVEMRRLGKAVMAAAGSPGHFPDVAIPGGVKGPADSEQLTALVIEPDRVFSTLIEHAPDEEPVGACPGVELSMWGERTGNTIWVTSEEFGPIDNFPVDQWPDRVLESRPGQPAPRPEVVVSTGLRLPYRVGPICTASIHRREYGMTSVLVEEIRRCLVRIAELREGEELYSSASKDLQAPLSFHSGTFSGVVDGPRGLLAHTYTVDEAGTVLDCSILTPTAQNELWMSEMLRDALTQQKDVEVPIRSADPCLPCSAAPQGHMAVTVTEEGHTNRRDRVDTADRTNAGEEHGDVPRDPR